MQLRALLSEAMWREMYIALCCFTMYKLVQSNISYHDLAGNLAANF